MPWPKPLLADSVNQALVRRVSKNLDQSKHTRRDSEIWAAVNVPLSPQRGPVAPEHPDGSRTGQAGAAGAALP